jgi:hypothetical protein
VKALIVSILCVSFVLPSRTVAQAPEVTMEDLPSFIDPLELSGADKLPTGKVTVEGDQVCYDALMNSRLLLTLKSIKPASDLRAKRSFQAGYLLGFQSGADEVKTVASKPSITNAIFWLAIGSASSILLMEILQ